MLEIYLDALAKGVSVPQMIREATSRRERFARTSSLDDDPTLCLERAARHNDGGRTLEHRAQSLIVGVTFNGNAAFAYT